VQKSVVKSKEIETSYLVLMDRSHELECWIHSCFYMERQPPLSRDDLVHCLVTNVGYASISKMFYSLVQAHTPYVDDLGYIYYRIGKAVHSESS